MSYCWEVYRNSKCENCLHYIAYQNGTLKIDEVRDIVIVDVDDNDNEHKTEEED